MSPPTSHAPGQMASTAEAATSHEAAERLHAVQARISRACGQAHRADKAVALLAVSKTWDASRVLELARLGQTSFAENYLQEALEKIAQCSGFSPALEWHFIGPIQSNKTRPIAEHFAWVHSVDRERIARRLSEQRPAELPSLQVCLQVNVSGEDSKSGCPPSEAETLALDIAALPRIQLRGLMTIPEPSPDASTQRARFASLRTMFENIRLRLASSQPERAGAFDTLSMGMSDDLEAAILEGATVVRVGTALFGQRPRSITPSP